LWHRESSTTDVCISAEIVMCGTDRSALQLFELVLNLIFLAQIQRSISAVCVSVEFVMCGTDTAALQLFY
jgi:hypothetical protein